MEDKVKDAVLGVDPEDTVLDLMISMVIRALSTGRQIFPDVMSEPIFYRRHFEKWVKEGMAELGKVISATKGSNDEKQAV